MNQEHDKTPQGEGYSDFGRQPTPIHIRPTSSPTPKEQSVGRQVREFDYAENERRVQQMLDSGVLEGTFTIGDHERERGLLRSQNWFRIAAIISIILGLAFLILDKMQQASLDKIEAARVEALKAEQIPPIPPTHIRQIAALYEMGYDVSPEALMKLSEYIETHHDEWNAWMEWKAGVQNVEPQD